MKKQILIVDSDDRQIRRIIKVLYKAVRKWGGEAEVYKANTLLEADRLLKMADIELLITDTVFKGFRFGEYPGVEWIKEVRKIEKYVSLPVIFTASLSDPCDYAYEKLNCLGFVTRAFREKELVEVLNKAMFHTPYHNKERVVFFRKKGVLYPVSVKNIIYVETISRILHIHQINGQVLEIPHKPLAALWKESGRDCLQQCNKSTLINRLYVTEVDVENAFVRIWQEDRKLPIGKKYREAIAEIGRQRNEIHMVIK